MISTWLKWIFIKPQRLGGFDVEETNSLAHEELARRLRKVAVIEFPEGGMTLYLFSSLHTNEGTSSFLKLMEFQSGPSKPVYIWGTQPVSGKRFTPKLPSASPRRLRRYHRVG